MILIFETSRDFVVLEPYDFVIAGDSYKGVAVAQDHEDGDVVEAYDFASVNFDTLLRQN